MGIILRRHGVYGILTQGMCVRCYWRDHIVYRIDKNGWYIRGWQASFRLVHLLSRSVKLIGPSIQCPADLPLLLQTANCRGELLIKYGCLHHMQSLYGQLVS